MGIAEDRPYKHHDYEIRQRDPYAFTKYKIIVNWLPETPDKMALNAGCGSGEMTGLLAQRPGWRIDAIDVDPEAIKQSSALRQENGLTNVEIFQTSIEGFNPGKTYDLIVSNDVLEHIDDLGPVIQQFYRLLKPDGILYITVPAMQWLFGYHDQMLGHYRRYSHSLLSSHLAPYFGIMRWRYFGMTLIPIAILYSLILRKQYPVGEQGAHPFSNKILDLLLTLDYRISWPIGTSLIAQAKPRATEYHLHG